MSYTVQIRLKKKGVIVYQEAQTFARQQAAQAWAKRRETELVGLVRSIEPIAVGTPSRA